MIESSNVTDELLERDLHYLKLLSKQYPTIDSASTEIINLKAILNLPKGTEHFLSDVHGEYESFIHVLKNASGVIRIKIDEVFGNTLRESEKRSLSTLIYYPEQKLQIILKDEKEIDDWYRITMYRLIAICRAVSSKYTRSKVRKALPQDFGYIIEELLHEQGYDVNKQEYCNKIIETVISLERADDFIIAISKLIQRLVIDRLHIIGDIYDRGPGADIIMDTLMNYHSVDIEWGNHDIVWMGAAAGSEACIANVLRVSLRYGNLRTIEEGYGINLVPLATFALDFYGKDECKGFMPNSVNTINYSDKEKDLSAKMHKAITILQFKLEGEIIQRHKEYKMEDRLLLNKVDFNDYTVEIGKQRYKLNDTKFQTVNPQNPYALTKEEEQLMQKLKSAFMNSDKLQAHVRFLFSKGSIYNRYNSNLLYHGCIPMNEGGDFKEVDIKGKKYSGKSLLDKLDRIVREGYFNETDKYAKRFGMDTMWYLWAGADSPLFGKKKMATFEQYFIDEGNTHKEEKNSYYKYRDSEESCIKILKEFELDPENSHIVNGHVPVLVLKGESPIKANGKLFVIDGGLSKAYQSHTGIAGYTLIYNSYGLLIVSHEPFESTQKAIEYEKDIISTSTVLEKVTERKRVENTDTGMEITKQIKDLNLLLVAYKKGLIKEQH